MTDFVLGLQAMGDPEGSDDNLMSGVSWCNCWHSSISWCNCY
jgi:hypothetical protein